MAGQLPGAPGVCDAQLMYLSTRMAGQLPGAPGVCDAQLMYLSTRMAGQLPGAPGVCKSQLMYLSTRMAGQLPGAPGVCDSNTNISVEVREAADYTELHGKTMGSSSSPPSPVTNLQVSVRN